MKGKLKELYIAVKDEDHWKQLISAENTKILIADLFFPSFGRCEALEEGLRAFYNGVEGGDEKMQFVYADVMKIPVFKDPPKATAKPRFQIYMVPIPAHL